MSDLLEDACSSLAIVSRHFLNTIVSQTRRLKRRVTMHSRQHSTLIGQTIPEDAVKGRKSRLAGLAFPIAPLSEI